MSYGGSVEVSGQRVDAVRRFNRTFTRRIGVLREGLLHSPYSLAESRVLFEVGHRERVTASELVRDLGLDAGYLSRLFSRLEESGLVSRVRSEVDGRKRVLTLTSEGRKAFEMLDGRSREEISEMLGGLSEVDQSRLVEAMATIEGVLDRNFKYSEPFYIRQHEPGDMGWVVQSHGELYAREYGWDARFEALVANIVSDFITDYDPSFERAWIAEMNGHRAGCVFVVRESQSVAKLRLLLVDPSARGLGLGKQLVEECIRFARNRGYQRMTLWTNDVLSTARHIYEEQGFRLVDEETHHSFGKDLVGQNWELDLESSRSAIIRAGSG